MKNNKIDIKISKILKNLKTKPITILYDICNCGKNSILESISSLETIVEKKELEQNTISNENYKYMSFFDKHAELPLVNKILESHYFLDTFDNTFEKETSVDLDITISRWLHLMNLTNSVTTLAFPIIPILSEGLMLNKGDTLILEQPEVQLNPNLQLHMTDFY